MGCGAAPRKQSAAGPWKRAAVSELGLTRTKSRSLVHLPRTAGFGGLGFSRAEHPHSSFGHKRPNTAFLLPCGSLLAAPGNRPQIAAQRPDRVDRDDFSGTLQIDTIGTAQLNEPLSVAAAHRSGMPIFLSASRLCRISLEIFLGRYPFRLIRVDLFGELRGSADKYLFWCS